MALGYAVEDHIVNKADNVHITVIDSDPKAKQMRVAIVNKAWLAAMLSALAERDIAPDAAIPVSLCIDPPEKSWTILLDGQSGTLRRGPAICCLSTLPATGHRTCYRWLCRTPETMPTARKASWCGVQPEQGKQPASTPLAGKPGAARPLSR